MFYFIYLTALGCLVRQRGGFRTRRIMSRGPLDISHMEYPVFLYPHTLNRSLFFVDRHQAPCYWYVYLGDFILLRYVQTMHVCNRLRRCHCSGVSALYFTTSTGSSVNQKNHNTWEPYLGIHGIVSLGLNNYDVGPLTRVWGLMTNTQGLRSLSN